MDGEDQVPAVGKARRRWNAARWGLRQHRLGAGVAVLVLLAGIPCAAESRTEFWPGVDGYVRLSTRLRLYLLAAFVHAAEPEAASGNGVYRDMQLGAHLDLTLKPIFRPRMKLANWERERYIWTRIGYRYGTSVGDVADPYREHRGVLELTGRVPFPAAFWAVNRARVDLRDVDSAYSTRYRYRLAFERETPVLGLVTVPYVNAEFFYDSRYDTWNRERYQVGVEVVFGTRWRIEPYLTFQNDDRSEPQHVNAFGLTLKYCR